jgi:leucyl aminopeptidase
MESKEFFPATQFIHADKPSTKLVFSLNYCPECDKKFIEAHGELAFSDFGIEKIHKSISEGVRHVLVKVDGEFTLKSIAGLACKIISEAMKLKIDEFDVILPEAVCPIGYSRFVYSLNVANYRFDCKKPELNKTVIKTIHLVHSKGAEYKEHEEYKFFSQLSESKNYARDLVNRRPNLANCDYMVERCRDIASRRKGVTIDVITRDNLLANGLRLLHAVGKGSSVGPALVTMSYNGNPESDKYVALVGKGVVFDQGGENAKTAMIELMYFDKGGACAAIAAFDGFVALQPKTNVVCCVAWAENVISHECYRPSDIITAHNGLTVEILNTDAEGRLVLADALSWVQSKFNVCCLVDIATLTGASIVALGPNTGAVYSDCDDIVELITKNSKDFEENIWRMPLDADVKESMKGKHSDLRNINQTMWGGSIQGATFLSYFIKEKVIWAHIDMAGPVIVNETKGSYLHIGCTGYGVGLLMNFLRQSAKLCDNSRECCAK